MDSSIASMAKRLAHSSRWASLAATSGYSSSGTRSRVRQYSAETTSFFFSKSLSRLVAVVGEVLAGLHVVLVGVGPVQVDLLAVVRDGVLPPPGVAHPGEEVAVVVVTGEEGVDVVEDRGLQVFEVHGAARPGAQVQVLFAERRLSEALVQFPVGVYRVLAEGFRDPIRGLPQLLGLGRLPRHRAALQGLVHHAG